MDKTNKYLGRIGLSSAINYFTINNYTISLPINDTQWYDLIIEKNNIFQTVQCKSTNTKSNTIKLWSSGGTVGRGYDNILFHNLDILFCLDNKLNMFVIPVNDLKMSGNTNTICLRLQPNKNNQGFETYKYLVK